MRKDTRDLNMNMQQTSAQQTQTDKSKRKRNSFCVEFIQTTKQWGINGTHSACIYSLQTCMHSLSYLFGKSLLLASEIRRVLQIFNRIDRNSNSIHITTDDIAATNGDMGKRMGKIRSNR